MTVEEFKTSTGADEPATGLDAPVRALWWDAKGNWTRAHAEVDALETPEGMWVHAYLHRKEGDAMNAGYWYRRAGRRPYGGSLPEEWTGLAAELLRTESGAAES